jgi:hypothetical protein
MSAEIDSRTTIGEHDARYANAQSKSGRTGRARAASARMANAAVSLQPDPEGVSKSASGFAPMRAGDRGHGDEPKAGHAETISRAQS